MYIKNNVIKGYNFRAVNNECPENDYCKNMNVIDNKKKNKQQLNTQKMYSEYENNLYGGTNLSKETLSSLFKYSNDIITVLDEQGTILYESSSIENILGYKQNELVGKISFEYIHKEDVQKVMESIQRGLAKTGSHITIEYRYLKADGTYTWLESVGTYILQIPGIVVNSKDISEKKQTQKNIERLTAAVEQSSNTVIITDINGIIEYVNNKFVELTGFGKEEAFGKTSSLIQSGETSAEVYKDMWSSILTGNVWEGELKNKKKNGALYWEKIKITPVVDEHDRIVNFIAVKDDITEKKMNDELLKKNLKDKEIMLREIHHRVKNNLQIVTSLLNLQASSVDEPKLKEQLKISQNRVRSMALIHQLLYRSADLSRINMEEYMYGITSQLLSVYSEIKDRVRIKCVSRDIDFTIETAVPYGLLVNELITNSIKHGFPKGRKGVIKIELLHNGENDYELIYNDNGIGIPFTVVNGHVHGFGLYLIETLVSQLDGEINHVKGEGTTYIIKFKGSNDKNSFRIT